MHRICDWSHWDQGKNTSPKSPRWSEQPEGSGPACPNSTGAYSFHGIGSAGISMEVPSGSIRKSGGEPGKGAGGPSSTKHAICISREGRLAPSEETNVTPARSLVITEIAPPWLSPNSDLGASENPAFSRYQRTDFSISDTNTMTLGASERQSCMGPDPPRRVERRRIRSTGTRPKIMLTLTGTYFGQWYCTDRTVI